MEDYNTATLPHKKFYDLDLYERRRLVKAAKKGKTLVCASDSPRHAWSVQMLQSRLHAFDPIFAPDQLSKLCLCCSGGGEGSLQ